MEKEELIKKIHNMLELLDSKTLSTIFIYIECLVDAEEGMA